MQNHAGVNPPAVIATAIAIEGLLASGILTKRPKVDGTFTWGAENKLAVHARTGLPVDLFATTAECYINYLVCRTGGASTNKAICNGAIARGLKWCNYGPGFVRGRSEWDTTPDKDRFNVKTGIH